MSNNSVDTNIPGPGKKIKDRKVILTDDTEKKISELSGEKGLILYFYPKDNTPGCTTESCELNDNLKKISASGYSVVGVSPDSSDSHKKFTEKFKLKFPLIADTEKTLCSEVGVWAEKSMYGKKYMGVLRTTFVLDPSLKILKVYEKVKPEGHSLEILKDIEEGF